LSIILKYRSNCVTLGNKKIMKRKKKKKKKKKQVATLDSEFLAGTTRLE